MKTKYFKATFGWGTSEIDTVINDWMKNKEIEIIKLEYDTHTEKRRDCNGMEHDAVSHTALLIYKESN